MVAEGATTMPISYEKRREHRLKLVEQLPPALRGKIFLRNIEAFAALPDQARQTLEKAVQSGLTKFQTPFDCSKTTRTSLLKNLTE